MIKHSTFIVGLLIATSALAAETCPDPLTPTHMPHPAWFERPIIAEHYDIKKVPLAEIQTHMTPRFGANGIGITECTEHNEYCRIMIPSDVPQLCQDMILTHELAHIHGWPGDHPDGAPK